MSTKVQVVEPWGKSRAKRLLKEDIVKGVVTDNMAPKDVYAMRQEYKQYKYENFCGNLLTLKKAVAKLYHRMGRDCEAYGHDRAMMMERIMRSPVPWHRSRASRLLQEDVKAGLHKKFKPQQLYARRIEYSAYPLHIFRKHIYQEQEKESKKAFRAAKKKKKMEQAMAIIRSEAVDEVDRAMSMLCTAW